ncbi:hypothetical protein BAE44_0021224, partial [Dichanthelium oligosanthes]
MVSIMLTPPGPRGEQEYTTVASHTAVGATSSNLGRTEAARVSASASLAMWRAQNSSEEGVAAQAWKRRTDLTG